MGCCFSGEEEAKETTIPAPVAGQQITVKLKKQGMFDADYDVLDLSSGCNPKEAPVWMLVDTVGGLFTSSLKYYLKHRLEGQEESTILGACEIHNKDTEFDAKVTDRDVSYDIDFDSDRDDDWSDDGDSDNEFMNDIEFEQTRKIKAKFKLVKQCNLFSDREMTQRLGKLKVKAKGKYKRKTKTETEFYTDEEGNRQSRTNTIVKQKTKVKKFYYKFNVMGTEMHLECKKNRAGGSFWRSGLEWRCTSETGAELFKILGDGRNATVTTCPGSDPSSTLLAAFAVACKFDPKEVQDHCEGLCRSRIH